MLCERGAEINKGICWLWRKQAHPGETDDYRRNGPLLCELGGEAAINRPKAAAHAEEGSRGRVVRRIPGLWKHGGRRGETSEISVLSGCWFQAESDILAVTERNGPLINKSIKKWTEYY